VAIGQKKAAVHAVALSAVWCNGLRSLLLLMISNFADNICSCDVKLETGRDALVVVAAIQNMPGPIAGFLLSPPPIETSGDVICHSRLLERAARLADKYVVVRVMKATSPNEGQRG
jgi:hypothetical protein